MRENSMRENRIKENRADNRKKNIEKQLYQGNEKQQRNTDRHREQMESAGVRKSEKQKKQE